MNDEMQGAANNETDELLRELWRQALTEIEAIKPEEENWKIQTLPLARIKKIMKTEELILKELEKDRLKAEGVDPETEDKPGIKFMIAGEAPVVVSRACELLIREMTCRAWQHTERNRRRTLQRQDIHAAVGESDVYDFLIDIVPRVTSSTARSAAGPPQQAGPEMGGFSANAGTMPQQGMDQSAHIMGHALGGAAEFMDPQQQNVFSNIYFQMQQQQQQQHANAVAAETGEQGGHNMQQNHGWAEHQS